MITTTTNNNNNLRHRRPPQPPTHHHRTLPYTILYIYVYNSFVVIHICINFTLKYICHQPSCHITTISIYYTYIGDMTIMLLNRILLKQIEEK